MNGLVASLIEPRLCDLLPSISKGRVKLRFCTTCGKQYAPPYVCPLDQYREIVTHPDREGKGGERP